ncbi:phosphate acyltransferase, partial [Paracoccaceae bacterium]|nr:phosphate acyltransferase [Paracoccaceae bacterium]
MKKEKKITLSVDCMGGDNSIDDIIGGVQRFCSENTNDNVLLHGNKKLITKALDKYPEIKQMCKIRHCDKVVQMGDKPSQSIRGGKNSSMWNSIESVKKSRAEVAISCGNTGSLMAISTLVLRKLPN